jgi:hypothetical protein
MVRLFGRNNNNNKQRKQRSSPSAWTLSGAANIREHHPMYQYALDEYAQAVPPGTSNDDGRMLSTSTVHAVAPATTPSPAEAASSSSRGGATAPSALHGARISSREEGDIEEQQQQQQQQQFGGTRSHSRLSTTTTSTHSHLHHLPTAANKTATTATTTATTTQEKQVQQQQQQQHYYNNSDNYSSNITTIMPEAAITASYEEVYGEAYIGGTIKYVYPSGYQSMRPRSCPWKLSIAVCLLFTWLSVFIVGHCSDQTSDSSSSNNNDNASYNSQQANDDNADDDDAIDVRWCGSRPLYLMWVASMLVTGISAAYCSVIGYIKVRDFAVANSRSQPPGVAQGKSDYYVRIGGGGGTDHGSIHGSDGEGSSSTVYRPTIYQSDGTPQFWGAHIYRPTQAAVAVTSR